MAIKKSISKIEKYLLLNEKRLDHPDLFTLPENAPAPQFIWRPNKVALGEILLALYHSRALQTPSGMFPSFTEIVNTANRVFGIDLGEPSDIARKVRDRNDRTKYLRQLMSSLENTHE